MMGQQRRTESLFYYFRLEDQIPEDHLLRLIDRYVEVEAMPALFHQEPVAAKRMIERVEKLGLRPESLGADKA